ncbi:hypothetical protein F485_gp416 [Aeromonas phage CC2]|uniref:Uncharacterized protein n=1 Tax=Aeromonas phage CC2 TaxID=1204516 RepID=I6WM44_9CAUD|nr:hypothetical protein F485_gp416 [Aeromonas phage CC2]AFN39293.1 hypothetical protein CC2_416 [Aeromonas phage CC2]
MKKKYKFKSQKNWDLFIANNNIDLYNSIRDVCAYPKWFTIEEDEFFRPVVISEDRKTVNYHPGYTMPFSKTEIEAFLDSEEIILRGQPKFTKTMMMEWAMNDPEVSEYIKKKFDLSRHIKSKEIALTKEIKQLKIRERDIYKELESIGSNITPSNFYINLEE